MVNDWKELSVVIAGCGSIGKRHAGVLSELGVRDIRLCDTNADSVSELAAQLPGDCRKYSSYEAALADKPDAVFICTPAESHVPMALAAVKKNIHVMCEKPVSNTLDGVDELDKLARESNVKVMVALCFRYHQGVLKLREYLSAGRIGRIVCIRALMGEYLPEIRPDYRSLHPAGTLGAFDLMHDLDLALWIADSPVKNSYCISGNYSDINLEAPDMAEFILEFEKPCAASVHLDFFHRPRRRQFNIIGTEGCIELEFAQWEQCTIKLYDAKEKSWFTEHLETRRNDMFKAEDKEFLQTISKELPVKCSISEGRKSLELVSPALAKIPKHSLIY